MLKKYKWIIIAGAAILVVLAVVPFLIPMSAYIGQAEQLASSRLGVPVRIGSMRIAFLPTPRLKINDMVVGADEDFSVEGVAVVPALGSLFSEVKTISSLQLTRPVMKKSALDILSAFSKESGTDSGPAVVIREISIQAARLLWPDMNLPEFDVDIEMTAENKPESARLATTDGKLKLDLVPEEGRQSITLVASQWTVPAGMPLLINKMHGQMVLLDNRLDIQQLDIDLYGGKVSANAVLNWQKDWVLNGKLNVSGMELAEPVGMASKSTRLSGRLFGGGSFKSTAKEPGALADHISANFQFKVEDGVLYGMDLLKAATLLLTAGQSGGETRFDTLSGLLNISGKQYHLRDLKVVSGVLNADGNVKIKPGNALDGEVKVAVKKGTVLAAIPLHISGTLDSPMVLPTKAALLGAAAGTAILGPGVGTNIGIQAVDKVKNLFGGSKE
ncbi:hypothetical protein MTYP_00947 [Methylophilaceae bacterium]|nr:hypothetical protein MTYP_00947 [Methylophilaceae bacterium]